MSDACTSAPTAQSSSTTASWRKTCVTPAKRTTKPRSGRGRRGGSTRSHGCGRTASLRARSSGKGNAWCAAGRSNEQHTTAWIAACSSDAQFFVAREHGFASWPKFAAHLESLADTGSAVSRFEQAADAIVRGDASRLARLLTEDPGLVKARSTCDHQSTLLHDVSANGIEDYRQRTPKNIVEIAEMLLKAGADPDATSDAYGGGSTPLGLTATSMHPESAGVQIPLLKTLIANGAKVEKEGAGGNGHGAIEGCLANGQGDAARFFASLGVPLNFVEAAGVCRLDIVKERFAENAPQRREMALLYACGYGCPEVAGKSAATRRQSRRGQRTRADRTALGDVRAPRRDCEDPYP